MKASTEKTFVWIIKIGLMVVPFLPLLVTRSLFFPFITGKSFAFRIIIELLAIAWISLMLSNRRWRPVSTPVLWAFVTLVAVMTLSTIFGIWPAKGMWSSFERMEGLWSFFHFLGYFLMLVSIFKEKKDWQRFFGVSIAVSIVMSFYGILQLSGSFDIHQGGVRLDGTMGNATYLAIYLVFHVFLLGYVYLKTNKNWLKIVAALAIILELFIIYHTATRGAILGLIGGIFIYGLISAIWGSGGARKLSFAAVLVAIAVPIVFLAAKNTDLVRGNDVLNRFASISLEEKTTQSRFIIWGMAFEAWKERPILGWGPESFVYIFSQEFDVKLWRQEPWFDRAHNVLLDWLTATGVVGLLAYLSIFLSVIWMSWKMFRRGMMDSQALGILVGLLAAYFIHNLFVFDNFVSYFLFFAVIAYIHWGYTNLSSPDSRPQRQDREEASSRSSMSLVRPIIVTLVMIAVAFSIYSFNIKPIKASKSIIDTLRAVTFASSGSTDRDLSEGLSIIQSGINLNTFGTAEIREQLTQYTERITRDTTVSEEDKDSWREYSLSEIRDQVDQAPYDVRAKIFLATLESNAGNNERAIASINEALVISPNRQQFLFLKGQINFRAGNEDLALITMREAYELDRQNPEAVHNYAIFAIYNNQAEFAQQLLQENFGQTVFADIRYINAYGALNDLERIVLVWEKLVENGPTNIEYRLGLTSIYLKLFRDEAAIEQLMEAIKINPAIKSQADEVIGQIRAGTVQR